jgi:hypothetical protein
MWKKSVTPRMAKWPAAAKKCSSRGLATQGDPRFTILHRDPPTTMRRSLSREGSKSSSGNPSLSAPISAAGRRHRPRLIPHRTPGHPRRGAAARSVPAETNEQDYKQRERSTLGFRDLTTEQMSAEHGTSARGWATAAEGAVRGRMQGARERAVDGCGDEAEADTQRSLASGRGGGVWRCDWSGAFVSELGVGAAGGRGD